MVPTHAEAPTVLKGLNTVDPLAALGGAAFLVTADLLARVVMPPNEVPVGILTALVGGPAFLLLLRRTKREYRF